jgi:hypothetical protein
MQGGETRMDGTVLIQRQMSIESMACGFMITYYNDSYRLYYAVAFFIFMC